jgi:hypothetical protein
MSASSKGTHMNAGYETGMKIMYEPQSRAVVISFRGRIRVLPGRFGSEAEGITAGESYCRLNGWRPAMVQSIGNVIFRSAW